MSDTLARPDGAAAKAGADPKWWTLAAVCTGVFMLLLDITIVNVALHDIQVDLKATLSDAQWVLDAYALSLAALLLTAGSLADLFGRKRVFLIGVALFTVASAACGLANDSLFLIIARGGQGLGGAIRHGSLPEGVVRQV
jgi:MFS family permease